jgi:flagellar assembly factor FliW
MLKVESSGMGTVEIEEDQILFFHRGLPGFHDYNRFVLLSVVDMPFSYLQSLDNESLAFVVADPFSFYPSYEFDLSDSDLEELQVKTSEDLQVYGIITLTDNVDMATMNLVAPVVLNVEKKLGKQIILAASTYTTKHKLFQATNER